MDEERIFRSLRLFHRDESKLLHDEDVISIDPPPIFDRSSRWTKNASRSSRSQRLSLEYEDVSFD
jgi:hypothetical protein